MLPEQVIPTEGVTLAKACECGTSEEATWNIFGRVAGDGNRSVQRANLGRTLMAYSRIFNFI